MPLLTNLRISKLSFEETRGNHGNFQPRHLSKLDKIKEDSDHPVDWQKAISPAN